MRKHDTTRLKTAQAPVLTLEYVVDAILLAIFCLKMRQTFRLYGGRQTNADLHSIEK
jgi:hypothetical protein